MRQHIFVIINASSKRNSEARECSSSSPDRYQKSTADKDGGEDPQMDVRSMTVAGIAKSVTEDEDHAEYFVDHEDAGELQDPLVDNAETEEGQAERA